MRTVVWPEVSANGSALAENATRTASRWSVPQLSASRSCSASHGSAWNARATMYVVATAAIITSTMAPLTHGRRLRGGSACSSAKSASMDG
jgi:hypothetical protein